MPSFVSFKDLKITFKPHPITNDLQLSKDEAAVKQAVINLIMTVPGERPFQSAIGSELNRLLFEQFDYGVAAQIETEIKSTINNFEPRVNINSIDVTLDYDANAFAVHLEYDIRGRTDMPNSIDFLLQRTQ